MTRITRRELTLQNILESDRRQAEARAEAAVVAESCELAPLSYAALLALRGTPQLGEALAELPEHLVRPQAVRFLVERRAATGALWGWGDVDDVEARFRRLIGATRAEQLARRIGEAQARKIAEMMDAPKHTPSVLARRAEEPEASPATEAQRRFVLRLTLDLLGSPYEADLEATLAAAGVPTNRRSWAEALEVAGLTAPAASRLISSLLRLRELDERGCDDEVVVQQAA